jgi:Lar family restriction alleviation protein
VKGDLERLPCPFCGSTDVFSSPADQDPNYDDDYAVVAVCGGCGAQGPERDYRTAIAAFAAWNDRGGAAILRALAGKKS